MYGMCKVVKECEKGMVQIGDSVRLQQAEGESEKVYGGAKGYKVYEV